MAATVLIRRLTGAGPTATDITSINTRAVTDDSHSTNTTSNPIPIPSVGSTAITNATNATPIVVTATGHGLTTGDRVIIESVGGNTNANGTWKITVVDANSFNIDNRAGNAAYTSGGTVRKANLSYWINTRLDCTVAPAGTINNLKWYTDGGNGFGTGVNCKVATATSYVQATGTVGTTGDAMSPITGGYGATLSGVGVDAFTYTTGSPLSVTGSTTTTGQFGDRVVYQIEVISTAGPGTTATETFTWRFDET